MQWNVSNSMDLHQIHKTKHNDNILMYLQWANKLRLNKLIYTHRVDLTR